MAKVYKYTTSINIGGDVPDWEGEVTFGYSVQPYEPETDVCPANGACVIDLEVLAINGKPRPWNWDFRTDDDVEEMFLDRADGLEDDMLDDAAAEMAR
jgi:hypothetical protein